MKKLFFSIFIFFAFFLSLKSQNILEIQQKRFEATSARDSILLEKYISEDLFYIHSNGLTENKKEHIHTVLVKKIVYNSFEYLGTPKILKRKKTQIINGTVLVKGLFSGTPFESKLLFTAVYEKKNRKWQLLRWQSTKIN
jgi:Domain of unknown function (DUF4440)